MAVLERPGVWGTTPLLHSVSPHLCVGRTTWRIENMPGAEALAQSNVRTGRIRGGEVMLKPGMVFVVEPNACIGWNRVYLGGAVVVTENEAEELNKLSTEMRIAGEA